MTVAHVDVATVPPYRVHVGPGALEGVPAAAASADRVAVIADETVLELHGPRLAALDAPRLALPSGEESKSLERLGEVLDFLCRAELSRASLVVTFGGGVACDLGGLAASLYKRGVAVVHCPTTLLAQVDASVGGKTAVNLPAGKNLAGTFHQPRAVFADADVLETLPANERASGLGEVVKTALVGGERELADLERDGDELAAGEPEATARAVRACVSVKAAVVASDPEERGPRRALNLGHTFGHAIEHAAGYGVVPHGVAVGVGLTLALRASAELGLLEDAALPGRVRELLGRLGLPASLAELRERTGAVLDPRAIRAAFGHDKKGRVGRPELVLPRSAGAVEAGVAVGDELLDWLSRG